MSSFETGTLNERSLLALVVVSIICKIFAINFHGVVGP